MKKILKLTSFLMIMMVFVGCASRKDKESKEDNELVGKWRQEVFEGGISMVSIYDFKSNGRLTQTVEFSGQGMDIAAEGTCDYTYENNTITFKISGKDMTFTKVEFEGLSAEETEMVKEAALGQMTDMVQTLTDVKINGDTLTANFDGNEITMTRM